MLSDRQIQLLSYIIQEYIENSRPVGSTYLVQKYNLKCSAATVRNEMANLIKEGFLEMVHTSSGRVPTPRAYRFFLSELLEEEELPVLQEVAIKQQIWSARYEMHKLLQELVTTISDTIQDLTIATTDDGFVVHAGAANLLDEPEFWNIDTTKAALQLVDKFEILNNVLKKAYTGNAKEDVYCLIGGELPGEELRNCALATTRYRTRKGNGFIAVLGPARMRYERVLPTLKYAKELVEELAQ